MVIYWDAVVLFNFLTDYLLLYSAMRLSGRDIGRKRLMLAALSGAAYAGVQLLFPRSFLLLTLAFLTVAALAFYGSGRAIKLTLLFLLLCCAFGGGVLLLGNLCGQTERLIRGVMFAELPWGVFFAVAGLAYLIFCIAFRSSGAHDRGDLADVTLCYQGKSLHLRLLRDTGNTLRDSASGVGIPVISESALRPLLDIHACAEGEISYHSVGKTEGILPTFCCDRVLCNGVESDFRRIAVTESKFGDSFVGILPAEAERRRQGAQKSLAEG